MGCTSLLRSPKKEQEVPDAITSIFPNSNQAYTYEDFNILDELEGVWNTKEEQKLPQQSSSSGELHWNFMEWEVFLPTGEEGEDENEEKEKVRESMSKSHFEEQQIKRENIFGFREVDDEKMMALNLNLNYQEVLDAWSDRGSPWADDCSLSLATNNGYYMGEVPVWEEERARREASVLRYKEKRQNRLFSKKIRYQVRKLNADKRPRIKVTFKFPVSFRAIGFCSVVVLFCNESSFSDIFVVGSLCEETLRLLKKDPKPKISSKISKTTPVHLFLINSNSNILVFIHSNYLSYPIELEKKKTKYLCF
ncbi:CHLOROPLAST IMPORT APPARATUS 2 [Spatholobus suberectus]|nr:CHLOROPLAST IMPORT APPARATUS 2 [Spatholobus suberectus]